MLRREQAISWHVISWQTFLCVMALGAIKWFFPPTGLISLTDIGKHNKNLVQKGLWDYLNIYTKYPWVPSVYC